MTPPRKRPPIDAPERVAYMTSGMEGGIIGPTVDVAEPDIPAKIIDTRTLT